MIRDKLVFSRRDDTPKLKLYDVGAVLILRKTTEILLIRELTSKELANTKAATVDACRQTETWTTPKSSTLKCEVWSTEKCGYCNKKRPPGKENCPATITNCRKCNKVEHFAIVCRSFLAVHEVRQDDHPGEGDYLVGGVRDKPMLSTDPGWHVKLKVGSQELTWCIDNKSTYMSLHHRDC